MPVFREKAKSFSRSGKHDFSDSKSIAEGSSYTGISITPADSHVGMNLNEETPPIVMMIISGVLLFANERLLEIKKIVNA